MASYTQAAPTASRPDLVPNGEYKARVSGAEEKLTGKGDTMIELKLDIEMPDGSKGPMVYDNLIFTQACGWKIDQFRAAIGETVTPGEEIDVNADDLIDAHLVVKLTSETYNGKKKNRVAAYIVAPF